MKKLVTIALGAALIFTMVPVASNASHCPGSKPSDPGAIGPVPTPSYTNTSRLLWISSGNVLPTYPNPVWPSGLTDIGGYGCSYQATGETVNTNYIIPGAAHMRIGIDTYPGDPDNIPGTSSNSPAVQCYRINGALSSCSGTGAVSFKWTYYAPGINNNCPCFYSPIINVPSNMTQITVIAQVYVKENNARVQKTLKTVYTRAA